MAFRLDFQLQFQAFDSRSFTGSSCGNLLWSGTISVNFLPQAITLFALCIIIGFNKSKCPWFMAQVGAVVRPTLQH